MSAAKSERLLNLVILLLVARNYTTKDQIRALMEPYRDSSDEAFDRMFERDKDDLRALGIPLEVGFVDKFFEDEQGYRIKRDAFELPEIDFTADEVAVLGLAARVWRHAGLAAATSDALVKLKAAGLSFDREQLDQVAPALAAEEPAFEAMWQATVHRTPVRFDYTRAGESESTTRHLQPWGVITAQGRWYVAGLDTDRGEPRMFRLSRIVVRVSRPTATSGSYTVPEGTDLRALSETLAPRQPDRSAVVLARPGAANGLRRRATVSATGVTGPDGTLGWDELAGALRLRERLRRRAPGVRRRGGRRVARRAAGPPSPSVSPPSPVTAPPEPRHERRTRAGLAAAGPGALPPDAHRRVPGPGGRGLRGPSRPDHEGPQGPLDVRAPRAHPGQDDRRRLRGDRGRPRRRRTHRQRGLPLPPGPARQLRGLGADRGAAGAARGQPRHLARGDRPVPGQARGGHRQRARPRRRSQVHLPQSPLAVRNTPDCSSEAIRSNRQARLDYYVPTRDETTTRTVDPLELLAGEGHDYLDAWCHLAQARRLFRLDRMHEVEIVDEPRQEHDLAPRDLSDGLFEPGPGDVEAVMHLERYARWVADYYPVDSVEELGDGRLEATAAGRGPAMAGAPGAAGRRPGSPSSSRPS